MDGDVSAKVERPRVPLCAEHSGESRTEAPVPWLHVGPYFVSPKCTVLSRWGARAPRSLGTRSTKHQPCLYQQGHHWLRSLDLIGDLLCSFASPVAST